MMNLCYNRWKDFIEAYSLWEDCYFHKIKKENVLDLEIGEGRNSKSFAL